jgi:hypothetical protein
MRNLAYAFSVLAVFATQHARPKMLSGVLTERTVGDFAIQHDSLVLVILWRGERGWHRRAGGSSASGRTGMNARTGEVDMESRYGDIELVSHYDARRRRVLIRGREIGIDTANVIVVDRIDGVGGPPRVITMHERLRLPPRPPAGYSSVNGLLDLLRGFERVREYVR